ncbi:hypothetical protein RSA46_04660 [Pseudomonas oryzihabitans]|nr:hypothetical protein NS201_09590 [Pseudomonas psychrotolerans]KTT46056.1 hypothetical protein RSA46_04660 [Pseudomonas psychrotolerans]
MNVYTGRLAVLDRPLGRTLYYGLALLLGVLYVARIFPLDFLTGHSGFFFDNRTDPTQHITGMWAFVQDRWRFPLLYTQLLNAPEGLSVAYTDSIPLAAVFFKLIYPWLPAGSHYFGVWTLGCYVLQGMAGAYAAASFRGRTPAALLGGCLFALMMPALMIRIPHAALNAQFLLILLLGCYARLQLGQQSPERFWRNGTLLLALAATIHPYLIAMLYPLYIAAWLSQGLQRTARWSQVLVGLLSPLPLIALLLYVIGYLSVRQGLPPAEVGYIESSMNLLSPLLGTQLAPSVFLPSKGLILDATGLQIDGHNYLGVGLLAMLLSILLLAPRWLLGQCRQHWVMLLVFVGLTLYALSNRVYLGGTVLFEYPLLPGVEQLARIFRGSGRFFWPVGYGLLILALGFYLTRAHPGWRVALLALIVVQYADTRHHRGYLVEAANRQPHFDYDRTLWDARVAAAREVYLLPNYGCGGKPFDALFLQYFTALHAVPLNTGFIARVVGDCSVKAAVLDQPLHPGQLFVFGRSENAYSRERIEQAMHGHYAQWCHEEDMGTVCMIGKP